VYSLADQAQRLRDDNFRGVDKVDISGDEEALKSRRSEIVQGLIDSGIAASDADFVFNNLIDYVDTNCIPFDLGGPYTEAVPMVSEIVTETRVSHDGVQARTDRIRLTVELHYPFVKPSTNLFVLNFEWHASLTNRTTHTGADAQASDSVDSGYVANQWTDRIWYQRVSSDDISLTLAATNAVELVSRVRVWVTDESDNMVECVPWPTNAFLELGPIPIAVDANRERVLAGKECIDPRFNWNATGSQFWRGYRPGESHTLGRPNFWTDEWFARRPASDEGRQMHVSDAGVLLGVGELGNLLLGQGQDKKWQTIRLYDKNAEYVMNRVFHHFTLTNGWQRGLVNVNTRNGYALRAVFTDVPLEHPDSGTALQAPQVNAIVRALTNSPAFFMDVGDIGDGQRVQWASLLPGMTDLERESVITHSAGLLTTRHNLFTILLRADSYSVGMGGVGGRRLATSHAVAEVWRDPFRDAQGIHRCQIRLFRMLED
jgi:hypothetical protein